MRMRIRGIEDEGEDVRIKVEGMGARTSSRGQGCEGLGMRARIRGVGDEGEDVRCWG